MTRILFVGDAAATGFGTVTSDLGRGLLSLGEDVRFLSMNVTGGEIPEPLGSRTYTFDLETRPETIAGILENGMPDGWTAEAVIVLGDFFAARWAVVDKTVLNALSVVPSFHYCPIEGVDLPSAWKELWDHCRPVAMSKFGQAQIATVVGYQPPMIYHGVDTDVFYPVAPNRPAGIVEPDGGRVVSKAGAKRHFGMDPNRTHLLRTDRHMPRKRYNELFRALQPVLYKHPDVDLILHCKMFDYGGYMIDTLEKYPDWFKARIILTLHHDTWNGLSREELNILYNSADIYVSNSAEGFGLTVAEAVACGVPAVTIDYAATPELIGLETPKLQIGPNLTNLATDAGRDGVCGTAVRWHHLIDNEYDHFWAAVDEAAYAASVDRLLSKPSLRRSLGSQGPGHVRANFQWANAARQFADLIHEAVRSEAA